MDGLRKIWKSVSPILLALLLLALFLLPVLQRIQPEETEWVTNTTLFSMTQMFMLIALASGWNLTGGFTGYIDFGYAVFFGIGAYGTGMALREFGTKASDLREGLIAGITLPVLIGAIAAMIFALLIGLPTLRLKGPYFSIAMLGTYYAMREITRVDFAGYLAGYAEDSFPALATVLESLSTQGGRGMTLPPILEREKFYFITLVFAIFTVLVAWWIRRSEFGASLIAIREDEIGAEMRGINTTAHKLTAFAIAAFLGGIVGGFWAIQNTFIDPDVVYFESRTVDLVMMTMLGGLGTVAGPVIGAASLFWLRDVIWANFLDYHLIVQGLLLIGIVLFFPEGILGTLRNPSTTSLGRLWTRATGGEVRDAYAEPQEAG